MTSLDQLLFSHSSHEITQLKEKDFVADFPELKTSSQNQIPVISQQIFGTNKDVYISKHSRFADYPTHSHQFLEINYIYHGNCQQTINGKTYHFQAGDIILMDNESTQSIKALGEEDILINILFRNKEISLDWLTQLQSHNSIIYDLLLNASIDQSKVSNFAIFPKEKTKAVLPVLQQLLTEYFFPSDFSDKMIDHYLSILMYHLARTLSEVNQEAILEKTNDPYTKLLNLIEHEYQELTLQSAADRLNFNKNYLSNLVKERSGQTFTQLLHYKRLNQAKLLISSTQLPIQEIAQLTGFSNRTFFYKKFEDTFGYKPSDLRKK
ncbi:AraC family transcriptional regulator [Streptococcus moroccensis]|uniref:AraC-like DNA-binding protein/mannose-6-phosphate isomerase-like protein (Cupin superfamily) n=1 Tax=Streptococcus moroccensis TaxID=1451356 RepID=A0ABT9YT61_9STRE|nr:helix-turn-helix domain-containing protein [Streptococcus moroccensis]MDQ0223181.1 AraC-like DNA-binding protein/mannose-6-phosphate isomerase-like protein (cupin superfamily) [Streptococcus moroccensis]